MFCQNMALQDGTLGEPVSIDRLSDLMLRLQGKGAHNINLVTPTPHRDAVLAALKQAKKDGLSIPVLYNTGSYESVETIRSYEGLIDLYLPDLKYRDDRLAKRFSKAEGYFSVAIDAISEMIRQVGFMQLDESGLAVRGVRIRHLVLPGCVFDTRAILDAVAERFGTDCPLSLMSQYTPIPECKDPALSRRLTQREYDSAVEYCLSLGFTDVFTQGLDSVGTSYTPPFHDRIDL
ncbi:MAG: radical SAM protein [Clostridia bacterium]|nr:radical SAM protein [Clostridia bacterium]